MSERLDPMSETSALANVERSQFMPAMTIEAAVERYNTITEFVSRVLRRDVDYGVIPGTEKLTLLKPGAEKLTTFFGLSTRFRLIERIEDWTGLEHNGEPFFYYLYRCRLSRGDLLIAEADGSCNSRETKYRYRDAQRVCPECGNAAIIKGKEEYGGGHLCFRKKGGCGAKFSTGDPVIETQQVGRVPNADIADQVNTIQKMGQKRCLGSTTPILMKTSRGLSRVKLETMYTIFCNNEETIYLPGVDGTWRRVEAMVEDKGREIYRLELEDGSNIRATSEHRFPTFYGLRSVAELKVGDVLFRSDLSIDEGEGGLPEFGWVAGLFLAEGHFSTPTCTHLTLNRNEEEFADRIKAVAQKLGATTNISFRQGETMDVQVHGYSFAGLMRQFISGKNSAGKHLSRYTWRQGKVFLEAVLDGYLAGDGCLTISEGRRDYWRLGFTGKNEELAKDLRCICALLGYRISLKRSNARFKDVDYPTFVGWIKKPADTYNQKDLNKIVNIVKEAKGATVYDIQVDGDHLFCLANGIQTHNSLIAATLLAVNASEFFTQDVEDMPMGNGVVVSHATVDAVERLAKDEHDRVPASVPRQPITFEAEQNRNSEILEACHTLGRTEEQLLDWARKKYQVESLDELTPSQQREVLTFLRGKLAKSA